MRPRPRLRWLYRPGALPAVEYGEFSYSGNKGLGRRSSSGHHTGGIRRPQDAGWLGGSADQPRASQPGPAGGRRPACPAPAGSSRASATARATCPRCATPRTWPASMTPPSRSFTPGCPPVPSSRPGSSPPTRWLCGGRTTPGSGCGTPWTRRSAGSRRTWKPSRWSCGGTRGRSWSARPAGTATGWS